MEVNRCSVCGVHLALEAGQWRSCLPCRRWARRRRQEAELEAAHARAVLSDVAAIAGRATAAAVMGDRRGH